MSDGHNPKYGRYQDYVFQNGRFIGQFEEMYRDFPDPWNQTQREAFSSEKAAGINLLAKARTVCGRTRVLELGCGLGQYTARLHSLGLDVRGLDISSTAVAKATNLHPGVDFAVGSIDDYQMIRDFRPDVIVMAEISWYVLDRLGDFLAFLKRDLPDAWLLHMLMTYERGEQKFGREYFTCLDEILIFFDMTYLESGEVRLSTGGARTWFLGTWNGDDAAVWNSTH